jgi:hypothetical protein
MIGSCIVKERKDLSMVSLIRLLVILSLLVSPTLAMAQQLINGSRVITGTLNAATTTGTSVAYVLPLNPAISAYVDKQCFTFKAHLTNTGPATLNVNTVGAVPLKRYVGGTAVELEAGAITSGQVVLACWDGAAMQLVGAGGSGGAGGGSGAVDTVFGRSGAVVAQTGDYNATQVTNAANTTTANVFTHANGQSMRKLVLPGSTSGSLTMQAPATAGTGVITWPAGSLDFTGTGGPGQVIKQVTSGAGLTVGSLTSSDVGLGNVDNTSDATKNSAPGALTGKHVVPRTPLCTLTGTGPFTLTPSADVMDVCILNALTAALTVNGPTFNAPNPRQSQYLEFRFTTTTPQALTWNAVYSASAGFPLPTLTTGNGVEDYLGYKYNFDTAKWVLVASTQAPVVGVTTLTSSTTYTCPATSNQCEMRMTSATPTTITIAPPSGTAGNGKMLMLRIMCTVSSQTIAMTTGAGGFVASPNVPLVTACPLGSSAWIAVGVIYSDFLGKWQVYATN